MAQNLMMDPSLLTGGGLKSKTLGQPVEPVAAPAPVKTKAPVQKKAAADVTAAAPTAAPAPAAPAAPQTSSEVLRSLTSGKITGLPTELSLGYNQYADILARQSEAKAKTKQLEDQQTQDILAGKASVLEESNQKARELYAQAQKDRWTEPAFSFEPHSLFNMAKMFSVLSTLGVMSGGKGKLSAQQTLAAMTGMLKGQRANDETEYKRQYQAYETNIAAIRAHNEDVRKDVEDMISLLSTDREAASLKKELAIRKEGSGSILASYLDAGNYDAALKLLDSRNNLLADVYKQEQAASVKWEQLRYQRQTAIDVANIRAKAATSSALLKPSSTTISNYVGAANLNTDLNNLKNQLKDPDLKKLINDYRAEAFLSEEGGKIGNQLLQTEIPSKLRRFIQDSQKIRNQYYLNISGKAVTGGEAMRNYGVVPQPGDDADVTSDKIDGMLSTINNQLNTTRKMYPILPSASQIEEADFESSEPEIIDLDE